MKKILIYARYVKEEYEAPFKLVLDIAKKKGYKIAVITDLHNHMSKKLDLGGIAKFHTQKEKVNKGHYRIEERTMIHVESDPNIFGATNFALNDFTMHKRDTSSMITIHTYVNGDYLNSYWADGIIVATPTGSTGYSLSCGGPIIFPGSNTFVITPVAPHNLNVRPLVIPDSSVISFADMNL